MNGPRIFARAEQELASGFDQAIKPTMVFGPVLPERNRAARNSHARFMQAGERGADQIRMQRTEVSQKGPRRTGKASPDAGRHRGATVGKTFKSSSQNLRIPQETGPLPSTNRGFESGAVLIVHPGKSGPVPDRPDRRLGLSGPRNGEDNGSADEPANVLSHASCDRPRATSASAGWLSPAQATKKASVMPLATSRTPLDVLLHCFRRRRRLKTSWSFWRSIHA